MTDVHSPSADLPAVPVSWAQIRSLAALLSEKGVTGLSGGYAELLCSDDRFLTLADASLLVFRHEDLRRLGADPRVSGLPSDTYAERTFRGPPGDPLTDAECGNLRQFQQQMFFTGQPEHFRNGKLIFGLPLAPKSLAPLVRVADKVFADRLARLADGAVFDIVGDLVLPAALDFWSDILEATPAETDALREIVRRMAPVFVGAARNRSKLVDANNAAPEYTGLVAGLVRRAMARGEHFLFSPMAEQLSRCSDVPDLPRDIGIFMAANMVDGWHAMPTALAITLHHLLDNPAALAAISADHALIEPAIDEALRLNSAVPAFVRQAAEDIDYDGLLIPAGMRLTMHWSAGNRDPLVHTAPDAFDLSRPQRPLTTFGAGAKICPGRNLARAFTRAGILAILDAHLKVEPAGQVAWQESSALLHEPYPISLPARILKSH